MTARRPDERPSRPRRRTPGTRSNGFGLLGSDLVGGLVSIIAEMAVVAFFFGLALVASILVVWAL